MPRPSIVELHAIPDHGHYGTNIYYYNQDLFETAGIPLPTPEWTVDDLEAAAVAITAAPTTYGFRANGGGAEHMPGYLRMFGGDLLSEDGTTCKLSEEGSVAALRWLYDLQFTEKVDPCTCGDTTRDSFLPGTVGMYNWTPGFVAEFIKVPDWTFTWGAQVVPLGPDGQRSSQASGAFCITGNSKHPNEAFEVLDFFSTSKMVSSMYLVARVAPVDAPMFGQVTAWRSSARSTRRLPIPSSRARSPGPQRPH